MEKVKQPFKQVFRELYVKLPEELEKEVSMMFAGNQIQPKKTLACLKEHRWIADVEAPTLEYVVFYDRKNFNRIKIKDVPDLIYSEVIHQLGGHQLNVLPVHSQSRGKIFLPFLDEDPKTAEIMSKILFFTQDNKIKDPYILEQIR